MTIADDKGKVRIKLESGTPSRGDRIEIRGFGSFVVKHRRARQGRNPKSGALVSVSAKRVPFFKVGKELRLRVDGKSVEGAEEGVSG